MRRMRESGQATVEAAFLLPVLFVGLLLLMQPGMLLYDRLVMQAAASEGCRLLATRTAAAGDMAESCEAFIRHRLGAVPPVSCFHVHEGACSWDIQLEGDERSDVVRVTIVNEVRPLPLLDAGVLSGAVGYTLQIVAQKDTDPTVASLLMSLESVFAVLAGWVLLGDMLTAREALGCVLMMGGIVLAQLKG